MTITDQTHSKPAQVSQIAGIVASMKIKGWKTVQGN